MPDIWMDVDTEVDVPANRFPLTDDTDFKTIEGAVAWNAAGITVYWHFVTTAGVITNIQVTPAAAGDYTWSVEAQGIYWITIPASGGASADNDVEGFGYFTGIIYGTFFIAFPDLVQMFPKLM